MPKKKEFYSNNYEVAFWEAQTFLIAAEAISKIAQTTMLNEIRNNQHPEKSIGLQMAKHVNHSYAVELLLKCTMIIDLGYYRGGHNLFELFYSLKEETQVAIFERFSQYNIKRRHPVYFGIFEDVDIVMVLREAGEAFVNLRYRFEGKPTPKYELYDTIECIEYYIFSVKPELKKLKH